MAGIVARAPLTRRIAPLIRFSRHSRGGGRSRRAARSNALNRFQFFDIFVKRGVGFVMSIALLTLWLAVMLPVLRPAVSTQAAPWIFAIALIPIAVVIPWLFLIVSRALDRGWLGRRFAPGGGALALQGCAPIGDDRGTADRARARRA